ncbi:DNA polymerase-3 subunit gamma/tau [Microbacterium hydrothermale]|uniref:DNA polymerase III subunit gamma and tau n=1 Tax=Microbacterium hydrothermale TaxID=857427 RepID=UPI002226FC24|nr:DNA polymerase III subunit gamma and tau [Microbacterium hydrothermale]MCW2165150.1 DNA polymerase-3 subunit gamma/tau [Microbacterium hydrothermale]
MTTALYRRYRPEAFGEMIGQSQVTEPLMTALRSDRVGHAYLFSGPRGCGKTTSARILARCLNCAAGPTDTPCGVCDSCVELGRGGGGSLDVVEIDAASHNGVDDARDLRERAIFAPARDRFKIFILDEAHMVTQQGFNALLKLVEEPPAHVKFIFATTEPEKVLGTIRSRTHHYPFRLVPPAAMLDYVQELCESESVGVEAGVLPLVVRAGGGSPRDTLSLLDQLIAGSDADAAGHVLVRYERAVALLGYTHSELLDEVVDAFAAGDGGGAFAAVDRVVQTGQDPRRFVDDLLERLRDLIVVAATGAGASAVLRGVPDDELERMARQATAFGVHRLSRTADLVVAALDEMTGATSPRLQLELLVARVLTHAGVAQGTAPATAHDLDVAHTASAAPLAPATGRPASPAADIAAPGATARDGGAASSPRIAAPAAAAAPVASPGGPRIASPGVAAPTVASPGAAPTVASPGVAAPTVASPAAAPGIASPGAAPGIASPGAASSVASPGVAAPTVASPGAAPAVASPGVAAPVASPGAQAAPTSSRGAEPSGSASIAQPDSAAPARPQSGPDAPVAPAPGRSASGASAATARPHPTAPVADDADAPPPFTDDDAPPPFDDDGDAHPFDTAPTPGGERASMPAGATASSSRPAADGAPPSAGSGPAGRAAPATPRPSEANAPAQAADAPAASERSAAAESTASTAASASPAHDMTRPASTDATSSADDPSPLEPVAPTPPATPVGPIELGHVRDAWPEVLGQLQVASRSSWLVVSTATVAAFEAEVLTLAFRTSADLAAFKTRTPEGGPSEDLRQAIQAVLGVRVKYLARLEGDGGPGGSPRRPGDGSPAGPGAARSAGPTASAPRTASSSAPYASSVTEWAVAPIPTSDGGAPTALAVDDEPDDAVVEPTRIAPHAGAVLPPREVAPSVPAPDEVDDDDVIPPADETEAPLPPVVVPRMAPLRGGVQRYGEAVVRQMLGATYVRDEPYEPPTRFS